MVESNITDDVAQCLYGLRLMAQVGHMHHQVSRVLLGEHHAGPAASIVSFSLHLIINLTSGSNDIF